MGKVRVIRQVPEKSIILDGLEQIHYLDCYQIEVPSADTVDQVTTDLFKLPQWVELLMSLRNKLAGLWGLKTGDKEDKNIEAYYPVGSKAVFFNVLARNEQEIVMAEDDKHLNFRTSVLIDNEKHPTLIYFITVVHYNNSWGKLYFLPVKPFHKMIIKSLLKSYSNDHSTEQLTRLGDEVSAVQPPDTLNYKIGYWSAILLTLSFVAWIACFTGIALTSPLFRWTNLSDYLAYENTHAQLFQQTAKFFMLLFGPLYVLLINSFYEYASADKKVLVRISLLFGTAFAILSSLHYFVQLTAVRLNMAHGQTEGLTHFVQANPLSIMTAVNMLGWTLFLGLSSLFIFPVFNGNGLHKLIRYAFIINGLACLLGGVGYAFQWDVLTFLMMNLILGGAMMTITMASISLFNRLKNNQLL